MGTDRTDQDKRDRGQEEETAWPAGIEERGGGEIFTGTNIMASRNGDREVEGLSSLDYTSTRR